VVLQKITLLSAYEKAYAADRVAAFGGCIAVNRPIDKATAEAISSQYAEVIVAPDFEDGVMSIFENIKFSAFGFAAMRDVFQCIGSDLLCLTFIFYCFNGSMFWGLGMVVGFRI
jgi:AICAR transformylase/IMP cyclohydrolase PurH (only IMP cyclohydrolase domain in Aful)